MVLLSMDQEVLGGGGHFPEVRWREFAKKKVFLIAGEKII
jgi:hypothetical protein